MVHASLPVQAVCVCAEGHGSQPQDSARELQLTQKAADSPQVKTISTPEDSSDEGNSSDENSQQPAIDNDSAQSKAQQEVLTQPMAHDSNGADAALQVTRQRDSAKASSRDLESHDLAAHIPAAHHLRALSAGL